MEVRLTADDKTVEQVKRELSGSYYRLLLSRDLLVLKCHDSYEEAKHNGD